MLSNLIDRSKSMSEPKKKKKWIKTGVKDSGAISDSKKDMNTQNHKGEKHLMKSMYGRKG